MLRVESFLEGRWLQSTEDGAPLIHAITGEQLGVITKPEVDYNSVLKYARSRGGPALRKLTFHERARMLKKLAQYLLERKNPLYEISSATGATRNDSWIDIEGGIGTLFVYSSKGRRELPDARVYAEGPPENISKGGTFIGRHICTPLEGVALHINAFNFPCWGMLEKLSPTFLAGMPAIIKPASVTCYLTERMVKLIVESGILPDGALQLICGGIGDTFEHLGYQDVVTFTGSAKTGLSLKSHPAILANSVRFNLEADSLNFSMLGNDVEPGSPEFEHFIKEVTREMTVKAGQKCTAIRRTFVPERLLEPVSAALKKRLETLAVGDPAIEGVKMGPLAGKTQVKEVKENLQRLLMECEPVWGDAENFEVKGADKKKGAFIPPLLLRCPAPRKSSAPHDVEAFGPVNTLMHYNSLDEAVELIRLGRGSLVGSLFTADDEIAATVVRETATAHGRLMIVNKDSAAESTGHGSPLPHLIHGGPGRAGGGEEMGGIRGVMHYMQRTAIQGSPSTLTRITGDWTRGAKEIFGSVHPFRKHFEDLQLGDTYISGARRITIQDIERFADLSGDKFYAHMSDDLARQGIFEKRVAHGYFLVSAAAGLFVDPAPGPVLANYGLENLRFTKPVYADDEIKVRLTCKQKTAKETPADGPPQGVVAWDVEILNQLSETVATYVVLTLVRRKVQN